MRALCLPLTAPACQDSTDIDDTCRKIIRHLSPNTCYTMKFFYLALSLMIVGCGVDSEDGPNLSGDFVPDVEKSMDWLLENNHPAIQGEGKAEHFRDAVYSGDPLIHRWSGSKLTVILNENWTEAYSREWKQIDKQTFRTIAPGYESNSETITIWKIISPDAYFLEMTVNERTTREYFKRK